MRHPVIAYVFDMLLIVINSAPTSFKLSIAVNCLSYTNSSYVSSEITTQLFALLISKILIIASSDHTPPVGLLGELIIIPLIDAYDEIYLKSIKIPKKMYKISRNKDVFLKNLKSIKLVKNQKKLNLIQLKNLFEKVSQKNQSIFI